MLIGLVTGKPILLKAFEMLFFFTVPMLAIECSIISEILIGTSFLLKKNEIGRE